MDFLLIVRIAVYLITIFINIVLIRWHHIYDDTVNDSWIGIGFALIPVLNIILAVFLFSYLLVFYLLNIN